MSRGRRIRVAEGVYRDQYGLAATVKVGTIQREQRFAPDQDLDFIKNWQARTRADLRDELEEPTTDDPIPERGTYAGDLPRYLKLIERRVSYKADRSHLKAWLPLVGHLKRQAIRPSHVRAAFAAWQADGKSPRTIRHRRRVLRELYQALDGVHAKPPMKGVKIPRVDDPHPTPVPVGMIRKVAKSLKTGLTRRQACGPRRTMAIVHRAESVKSYARFLVRATTGQRPSQIMRAQAGDVDLRRRIWFVRAGKGGAQIPLPLNDDMVKAWKAFIDAKAWGPFDLRSFSQLIRRHGWPTGVRPYNLRHTFAIDLLLGGAELGDVQGLLGHRQIETTRKFYAPILLARLKKASAGRRLRLA